MINKTKFGNNNNQKNSEKKKPTNILSICTRRNQNEKEKNQMF